MKLPHNNLAASQQLSYLTIEVLSQHCGSLTILGLPYNKKLLTTMRAVARLDRNCQSDFLHDLAVEAPNQSYCIMKGGSVYFVFL